MTHLKVNPLIYCQKQRRLMPFYGGATLDRGQNLGQTVTVPADLLPVIAAPVPRYTSYPTAPHFHTGITSQTYADWLKGLPKGSRLSLYMHVPFCDTLCWFCGCSTKITQRYEPVKSYLDTLIQEIASISWMLPTDCTVTGIHWGGGSPTMLAPADMARLAGATKEAFRLSADCSFAIEVDPRGLDAERMDALVLAGLTRVSIGVQDFDPEVQKAINRLQSFEETKAAVDGFRQRGVNSLNIDALYGLPYQTLERLLRTLEQVVALNPDRIALFGYAHVPWMKRHQMMIAEQALPDISARYGQAEAAAAYLISHGYERVGIDHFALPEDSLAIAAREGRLKRNFQGYTVDPAEALIGFGATAIGALPQGYVQNHTATAHYVRAIEEHGIAIEKGVALSDEDQLRRRVIEKLMCDLSFSASEIRQAGGPFEVHQAIVEEALAVVRDDVHDFIMETPDGFALNERGRPFVRTIAARFDAYLAANKARHSLAV